MDVIFANLAEHPSRAFVTEVRGDRLDKTYGGRLLALASQARATLRASGIGPGDRVALLASSSARWVAADLAVLAEGAAAVPLDPRQAPDELVALMKDAGVRLVLCEGDELAGAIGLTWEAAPSITFEQLFDARGVTDPPRARSADDVVTILYTGGAPEGVMITAGNVGFVLDLIDRRLGELMGRPGGQDRVFHYLPLGLAGSRVVVWGSLYRRNGVMLSTDPPTSPRELRTAAPEWFLAVPSLLDRMKSDVEAKLHAQPRPVRRLYESALEASAAEREGRATLAQRVVLAAARRAIFARAREQIGADLRCIVCGSAPPRGRDAGLVRAARPARLPGLRAPGDDGRRDDGSPTRRDPRDRRLPRRRLRDQARRGRRAARPRPERLRRLLEEGAGDEGGLRRRLAQDRRPGARGRGRAGLHRRPRGAAPRGRRVAPRRGHRAVVPVMSARHTFEGEHLSTSLVDGTLEVRLHREPINEIGLGMLSELERVAELVREGAGGARALLVCSSVARGFSAGADLRELHAGLRSVANGSVSPWIEHARQLFDRPATAALAGAAALRGALSHGGVRRTAKVWGVRAFLDRIHRVFDTLDTAPIPTVAAVHGVCFGGGFELALTCDVIVADKSARFAFPELRLGLVPGFGGIPRLERDLGNAVVRDLLPERPQPRRAARARARAGRAARRDRPRRQRRAPPVRADGPLRSRDRRGRQALPQALPSRAPRGGEGPLLPAPHLPRGRGRPRALRSRRIGAPLPALVTGRPIPMTEQRTKVLDQLLTLAAERFHRERAELRADDDLFDTLDIDSMQALSLLSALEEKFAVEIPDYEVQDVRTFAELADVVASRL
ncbi:MAG: AMP-binding protein [Sandaracinaceae bacterium]|nr:AMP-binding protein [Sandaracinaceae bacterium]